MFDVFLSHSSKDKDIVYSVCEFLESRGLSCWVAPRNIVPGEDWAASISAAITSVKVFLVFYSANAAESKQMAREISLAETKNGVFVIPYKIDSCELKGAFEYYLNNAHWIMADYTRNDPKLEELYAAISDITGRQTTPQTAVQPAPMPQNTYAQPQAFDLNNAYGAPQPYPAQQNFPAAKKKMPIYKKLTVAAVIMLLLTFTLYQQLAQKTLYTKLALSVFMLDIPLAVLACLVLFASGKKAVKFMAVFGLTLLLKLAMSMGLNTAWAVFAIAASVLMLVFLWIHRDAQRLSLAGYNAVVFSVICETISLLMGMDMNNYNSDTLLGLFAYYVAYILITVSVFLDVTKDIKKGTSR